MKKPWVDKMCNQKISNCVSIVIILATVLAHGSSEVEAKSMPPEAFDVSCEKNNDCAISNASQEHNHCCIGCGFGGLNKTAAAFRKKWRNRNCDTSIRENCLIYECAIEDSMEVACEKGRCVLVPVKNKGNIIEKLRWIEKADPVADAKVAIERKDRHLFAVRGYTIFLPGISTEKQSEYRKKHPVRVIEGTTDAPVNEEHKRLNLLAIRYAEKYNGYLLGNKSVIGQTISEAIQHLQLKIGRNFVIEEPVGIARGVFGKTKQGEVVELYIRRGDLPSSGRSKWKLKNFENEEIIGIAKLKSSTWYVEGQVMLIRSMNAFPLKED